MSGSNWWCIRCSRWVRAARHGRLRGLWFRALSTQLTRGAMSGCMPRLFLIINAPHLNPHFYYIQKIDQWGYSIWMFWPIGDPETDRSSTSRLRLNNTSRYGNQIFGNHTVLIPFLHVCRQRITNSHALSLDWLSKTSRQVVIFIYRQRTN